MEFSYVAVNEKNRKYRNRMTANNKEEVKRKLEQRGLIAISIDEVFEAHEPGAPSGRNSGNRITSRMEAWSVSSMTSLSMPMPSPAAGGMPDNKKLTPGAAKPISAPERHP